MRKILLLIITLGFLGLFASTARAEYSISFRFGDDIRPSRPHHQVYSRRCDPWRDHHARPRVIFRSPVYSHATIIRTYDTGYRERQTTSEEKFGIADIIVLSRAGVSDDVIIGKIAKTGSVFKLTVEEVEMLRSEGVSSAVINYMLSTDRKR